MRYHEIASGLRVPVSAEETSLLDKVGIGKLPRHDLDERETEVARLMVTRGLLHREKIDGEMYFSANMASDVWRF